MDKDRIVCSALESLLLSPDWSKIAGTDASAIAGLCHMAALPKGDEDPKALVRDMSDAAVETAKLHLEDLFSHPLFSKVAYFLFIEWCWRHGHLEEDWIWEWRDGGEGDLRYKEVIPLRTLSSAFSRSSGKGS